MSRSIRTTHGTTGHGTARPRTLAAVLAAAALVYVAAVDPRTGGAYPACPLHRLTGLACPGCGGLRAVHDLLHGHLLSAASSNLLVVLAVPAFLLSRVPGPDARRDRWAAGAGSGPVTLAVILVVMLVFGVLRNLPMGSWLAA